MHPLANMAADISPTLHSLDWRMSVASDCAQALRYLHGFNILHRDIKSPNIMMVLEETTPTAASQSNRHRPLRVVAKVADFGVAKVINVWSSTVSRGMDSRSTSSSAKGTTKYMAPELLYVEEGTAWPYSQESDMYSFGVLLNEVMSGQEPWAKRREQDIMMDVLHKSKRPKLWTVEVDTQQRGVQERLQALVGGTDVCGSCWHQAPSQRPSASTLCDVLADYVYTAEKSPLPLEEGGGDDRSGPLKPKRVDGGQLGDLKAALREHLAQLDPQHHAVYAKLLYKSGITSISQLFDEIRRETSADEEARERERDQECGGGSGGGAVNEDTLYEVDDKKDASSSVALQMLASMGIVEDGHAMDLLDSLLFYRDEAMSFAKGEGGGISSAGSCLEGEQNSDEITTIETDANTEFVPLPIGGIAADLSIRKEEEDYLDEEDEARALLEREDRRMKANEVMHRCNKYIESKSPASSAPLRSHLHLFYLLIKFLGRMSEGAVYLD